MVPASVADEDAETIWRVPDDDEAGDGDATSLLSGTSDYNPVPSATTLSLGDQRAQKAAAARCAGAADYAFQQDTDDVHSQLSAHNPIVTPATSDAGSQCRDGRSNRPEQGRLFATGLSTINERPKTPPAYLLASHDANADDKDTCCATPPSSALSPSDCGQSFASSGNAYQDTDDAEDAEASVAGLASSQLLPAPLSDDDLAAPEHVPDDAHSSTHLAHAVIQQTEEQHASSRRHSSEGAMDTMQPATVAAASNSRVVNKARLAEYEGRLTAAQQRTSELTDYLTALQARVDEARCLCIRS